MFDKKIRQHINSPLNQLAYFFTRCGITANKITIAGFFIGLLCLPLIYFHFYKLALVTILLNRLLDGIDGAVARQTGVTHAGAYLDIVLDFIFYATVVFAFCLAQPDVAIYGALLIFSFIGTSTTFLTFAIFAEKLNLQTHQQGKKSFYYLEGLAEGFETIVVLSLMCLFPSHFWLLALIFAAICFISTLQRIINSTQKLSKLN